MTLATATATDTGAIVLSTGEALDGHSGSVTLNSGNAQQGVAGDIRLVGGQGSAGGANVVIQSHYINYTAEPIVVRDVVHLGFYQGDDAIEASYLILNHGGLDIAPGESSVEVSCQLPDSATPYNLVNLLGHMHEWGAAMDISHQPAGADWDVIYDIPDWDPEYRDLPPTNIWEADDPFVMQGGDRFRVRCDFDNGTDANIRFPSEMCTSVALYYPSASNGLLVCDEDGGTAD